MESKSTPSFEVALRDLDWVRRLARRLVVDPEAAEDLAQETWLAVLRSRGRAPGGMRAWLAGIARHLLARRLRSRAPAFVALEEHPAADSEDVLVQADFQRAVLAAVMALEEPYRTTILRCHFEGLSGAELARRLGVSSSTVRSRLQRAHALLRARLDRDRGGRVTWSALALAGTKFLVPLEIGVIAMKTAVALGGVVLVGGLAYWRVSGGETRGEEPREQSRVAGKKDEERPDVGATVDLVLPREERTAEARSPGGESAPEAGPSASSTTPAFSRSLDATAATFRTADPAADELLALVEELAEAAEILPDSVMTEFDASGAVKRVMGELRAGDLAGTFSFEAGAYRVEFESFLEESMMFQRHLAVGFHEGDWSSRQGTTGIQFHPRTNEPVSRHLEPQDELHAGWYLSQDVNLGTKARPVTIRRDDESWIIGNSENVAAREYPWLRSPAPFDAWLAKLAPFTSR
jgi:RNA polymerase sigma-70 factor (ECF subfamily)